MYKRWLRRLYQKQLDDTRAYLNGFLQKPPFSRIQAARLAPAVSDENAELLDTLDDILSLYAMYGVARDFERLKKNNVLRVSDKYLPIKTLPNSKPAWVVDLDAVLPLRGAQPTFNATEESIDPKSTKETAYQRYFDLYIIPPAVWQNGSIKTGIDAFYERYPLLDHAITTGTKHYQNNIKLACDCVVNDWNDIQGIFSWDDIQGEFGPGRTIDKLLKIRTTGNDFHKGGKQVLILTFGFKEGSTGRLVYKPSSVEIDCRIVGNSKFVSEIHPNGYRQDTSLTEIINSYSQPGLRPGGYTSRPLSTYKILPYNCNSVPDAYGYIEFLTHDPPLKHEAPFASPLAIKAAVGAEIATFSFQDVKNSDWITDKPSDGQTFYHAFGGLMAMAMAVSLCDLHWQNMIVHDRLPHLIDLEEALKRPFTTVKDTYLDGVLDRLDDPGSPKPNLEKDGTSDLRFDPFKPTVSELTPATSVLYFRDGSGNPRKPLLVSDDDRNRRALVQGFTEVIEALATKDCNDAVKVWVRGLSGTIARLVTQGTAIYARTGRDLYQSYPECSWEALDKPGGYNTFKRVTEMTGADVFFFHQRVQGTRKDWNDKSVDERVWNFFFAVEHPDHVWRDWRNCDVPSFYHKLGDRDLLNSKGEVVNVAQMIDWQNKNIPNAGALRGPTRRPSPEDTVSGVTRYFPEKPIDMIIAQLEGLRVVCQIELTKKPFLEKALGGSPDLSAVFRAAM